MAKYNVYKQELNGRAALKEAEWSKQILIEEAKAREQAGINASKSKSNLGRS